MKNAWKLENKYVSIGFPYTAKHLLQYDYKITHLDKLRYGENDFSRLLILRNNLLFVFAVIVLKENLYI